MENKQLAEELTKLAEELRKHVEEQKTASVELDPQRVLDFMLFYGR